MIELESRSQRRSCLFRANGRWLVMAIALTLGGCAALDMGGPTAHSAQEVDRPADQTTRRLTPGALQREIFAFADRYNERIVQVSVQALSEAMDGPARALVQGVRVTYVSSVLAVVSAPDPLAALRDLMVVVSLERQVWAQAAAAAGSDTYSRSMAAALRTLEHDIFALARRAVPARTIDELKRLIAAWRQANPDQRFVAFLRFENLGTASDADEVERAFAAGGLLAPVDAVAREVHDSRLLAERGVYLATRMPLLLTAQGEFLYQKVVASPEARDTLDNLRAYRDAISGLAREVELAPENVHAQGTALLDDLFRRLEKERIAMLNDTRGHVRAEREAIFAALSEAAGSYGPLLAQLQQTLNAARDVTSGLERLQGESAAATPSGPSALEQTTVALDKLSTTVPELRQLLSSAERLIGEDTNLQGLAAIDAMVASQLRWVFIYAAALVLLLGAVITASMLILQRAKRRAHAEQGA